MRKQAYPFAAIAGQEKAKKAVLLNIVNPAVGGLLLSGQKGTAKSTLLRSAGELLDRTDVIDMPLNTDEERLIGGFKMGELIRKGTMAYEPGLLCRANGHILYIDEVNLLPRALSSFVVDAASSGECRVEREGMSRCLNTRFLLFGSMNPEEGGIPPQLLDRFGLFVQIESETDVGERVAIIERRLAFESDPELFRQKFAPQQRELTRTIGKARKLLSQIIVTGAMRRYMGQLSLKAELQGHRGDVVLAQTARALAALDGRMQISGDDVLEAASLVFPHRTGQREQQVTENYPDDRPHGENPPEDSSGEEKTPQDNGKEFSGNDNAIPPSFYEGEPEDSQNDEREEKRKESDGEDPEETVFQISGDFIVPSLDQDLDPRCKTAQAWGKRFKTRSTTKRGRYVRARFHDGRSDDYAFDATMRAAIPWQSYRRKYGQYSTRGPLVLIEASDLRQKIREKPVGHTILFLVDASGSMGAAERMVETKGAVLSLLEDAYRHRDKVGLMAFRRDQAQLILQPTRSVDLAHKKLADLPVGGATPLALGLHEGVNLLKAQKAREPEIQPLLVLLTDGRGNVPFSVAKDNSSQEAKELQKEIIALAGQFSHEDIRFMVIDTETGWVRLGMAGKLAENLGGSYIKLDECKAENLAGAVRAAI